MSESVPTGTAMLECVSRAPSCEMDGPGHGLILESLRS